MEFRDVMYFQVVAELCHVGQAAERLGVTQPAVSKCIGRLEAELGGDLFIRTGRRVSLTPMGELLLQRSYTIRQVMDETTRQLHDHAKGTAGHIRIGSAATAAAHVLPTALERLVQRAPDVTVSLRVGMNDVLHGELRAGNLDVVVGPILGNEPDIVTTPVVDDDVVVLAPADHPIHHSARVLDELADCRWILPANSVATRQWLDARLHALRLPPARVQIETNSIANLTAVIARSGLLSFASRHTLEASDDGRQLRALDHPELVMQRRFGVARLVDSYLSPAAAAFLDVIAELAADCELQMGSPSMAAGGGHDGQCPLAHQ
jgi:DNA-binding transcriptional LysR family regulator